MKNFFNKWLNYLVFTPNFSPLTKWVHSEIFPWAFFYSFLNLSVLPRIFRYFILMVGLSSLYSMFVGLGYLVPLRSAFALLNASVIYFVVKSLDQDRISALAKGLMVVFLLNIGIIFFQFFSLIPDFVTDLMRLVLDRFMNEVEGYGRGVGGLFAEPSYASIGLQYFFAFYLFKYDISISSLVGIFSTLVVVLLDIFFVRSATGLVMLIVFLMAHLSMRNLVRYTVVSLLIFLSILYFAQRTLELPRSLDLAYSVIFDREYQYFFDYVLLESGHRAVGVLGAYSYMLSHPLGCGLGFWPNASIEGMESIGVDAAQIAYFSSFFDSAYDGVRPTSFAAGVALELGWVGLILFILSIGKSVPLRLFYNCDKARPILILFLFNLFFLGTIGDPIPFVTLGMVSSILINSNTSHVEV